MKSTHAILAVAAAYCGLALTLNAQTPPLTPSGPPTDPATAMKSLNQVEPRTIIDQLPYTISEPGSYYLARNMEFTAATGDAITVNASNVTIDLMGFTLSSTAVVTGDGIKISTTHSGVKIINGSIIGTTVVGMPGFVVTPGGFDNAVDFSGAVSDLQIHRLNVSGCRGAGLKSPQGSMVTEVIASRNGEGGIYSSQGLVRDCSAIGNAGDTFSTGISARMASNCYAGGNQGYGIRGDHITNCVATGNGGIGIECGVGGMINGSISSGNGGNGIDAAGGAVNQCSVRSNAGIGIRAQFGVVGFCRSDNNGSGGIEVSNGVVSFSRSDQNGGGEISATGGTRTGNYPTP